MRGKRARQLREEAKKDSAWFKSGSVGRTIIHGGWRRTYRDLKRAHRSRGVVQVHVNHGLKMQRGLD